MRAQPQDGFELKILLVFQSFGEETPSLKMGSPALEKLGIEYIAASLDAHGYEYDVLDNHNPNFRLVGGVRE